MASTVSTTSPAQPTVIVSHPRAPQMVNVDASEPNAQPVSPPALVPSSQSISSVSSNEDINPAVESQSPTNQAQPSTVVGQTYKGRRPSHPYFAHLPHPHPPPPPPGHPAYYAYYRSHQTYTHPLSPPQRAHLRSPDSATRDPKLRLALETQYARRNSDTLSLPQQNTIPDAHTAPSPRLTRSSGGSVLGYNVRSSVVLDGNASPSKSVTSEAIIESVAPAWSPARRSPSPARITSTYSLSSDEDDVKSDALNVKQAVRSMLHLSISAAPLSLAILVYCIFACIVAVLLAPLRFISKSRPCFSTQLARLLMPPLNLQRRCIYLQPLQSAPSRSSSSSRTPLSSNEAVANVDANDLEPAVAAGPLLAIHLIAPIVAIPLAFCAWVMGAAWALGAIVSDEQAGDDMDERRLVQRLISFWARRLSPREKEDVYGRNNHSSRRSARHDERGRSRRRPEMTTASNQRNDATYFA